MEGPVDRDHHRLPLNQSGFRDIVHNIAMRGIKFNNHIIMKSEL